MEINTAFVEDAKFSLHGRILRCPLGENPEDCPLHEIRKLPVEDRIAWLESNTDEEIIARMMIPLCIEVVRCIEEKIVASPAEADMALIYGIGFPPFRGGALHYMDSMGLKAFCEMAAPFAHLGPLYQPTEAMKTMAANGTQYFQ